MAKAKINGTDKFNLNLIVDSPAVICDMEDCYHIMIADLMDSHHPPGISGLGADGVDFAPGMWELAFTFATPPRRGRVVVVPAASPNPPKLDEVFQDIPGGHGAYVVIKIPRPHELYPISPVQTTIQDEYGRLHEGPYSTRVVLRYKAVTGINLLYRHIRSTSTSERDVDRDFHYPIDGEAFLTIDLRPSGYESVAHVEAAYRAHAKMIGVTRYMTQTKLSDTMTTGVFILNTPRTACKSPVIMVKRANKK